MRELLKCELLFVKVHRVVFVGPSESSCSNLYITTSRHALPVITSNGLSRIMTNISFLD